MRGKNETEEKYQEFISNAFRTRIFVNELTKSPSKKIKARWCNQTHCNSMISVPKLDKEIYGKGKVQTSVSPKYRHKNPKQNTNKQNAEKHIKNNT